MNRNLKISFAELGYRHVRALMEKIGHTEAAEVATMPSPRPGNL